MPPLRNRIVWRPAASSAQITAHSLSAIRFAASMAEGYHAGRTGEHRNGAQTGRGEGCARHCPGCGRPSRPGAASSRGALSRRATVGGLRPAGSHPGQPSLRPGHGEPHGAGVQAPRGAGPGSGTFPGRGRSQRHPAGGLPSAAPDAVGGTRLDRRANEVDPREAWHPQDPRHGCPGRGEAGRRHRMAHCSAGIQPLGRCRRRRTYAYGKEDAAPSSPGLKPDRAAVRWIRRPTIR